MSSRARLALVALGSLLLLAARALWFEPRRARVREVELALPGWPAELAGLTIALVADLHAGAPHVDAARVERIVARVNEERPDVACLLGDFVDAEVAGGSVEPPERVARALAGLRARHGTVAVLGNHDWEFDGERVAAALVAAGVVVLENSAVRIGPLWVAGVADATRRSPDIASTLDAVTDGAPVVLLSHDPDVFPRVPARVSLTLSGHTHGGQVALPRLRAHWTPSRFGERYAAGHIVEGGRHLFVSRGIGTSRVPVRLFSRGEVVLLKLR